MTKTTLIPAILTSDPEEIYEKLKFLETIPEIDVVHVDFADGRLVPNSSVLPSALWPLETRLKLEAHLMVSDPQMYFHDLEHIGARRIILHYESFAKFMDLETAIGNLKTMGFVPGIAVNPNTEISVIYKMLNEMEFVQVMGVYPGLQGQSLLGETFKRLEALRHHYPDALIQVDGGVNRENIASIRSHGADRVVVGSGIWHSQDPKARIYDLLEKIK